MSVLWQARIILAFSCLCLLGASYKLFDLMHWNARTIEAKGTIIAIEGNSAEQKPVVGRRKCNAWQTLHYRFTGSDGRAYQGKESVWWGDCRHSVGAPLMVYFDRNDAARSITKTGFDSRRSWAILLGILSFLLLISGAFFHAIGRVRLAIGMDD